LPNFDTGNAGKEWFLFNDKDNNSFDNDKGFCDGDHVGGVGEGGVIGD